MTFGIKFKRPRERPSYSVEDERKSLYENQENEEVFNEESVEENNGEVKY